MMIFDISPQLATTIASILAFAWTIFQEVRHKTNHGTHLPKK